MGYTHYMYLRRDGPQQQWSEAVLAARNLIDESPVPMGNGMGEPGSSPVLREDGIYTNGIHPEDGCETLFVPTVLASLDAQEWNPDERDWFTFCKTRENPYDVVVTGVYATLAALAPDCVVSVSGDGGPEGFEDGCRWASGVLGREIPVPPEPDDG